MYINMSVCLSVCIGFSNDIQPEANMHFNTLLFSNFFSGPISIGIDNVGATPPRINLKLCIFVLHGQQPFFCLPWQHSVLKKEFFK